MSSSRRKEKRLRNFFASKLYHNDKAGKSSPIFSILSDEKDFGISDIPKWKETHQFKNLFVVCNGQQTLPFAGEESSLCYGYKFAGIWIEKYHTYKIERKGSLASTLHDTYSENSLIVDFIDCKYNWEKDVLSNTTPVFYAQNLISEIVGKDKPKIFFIGFSRGASFALRLAECLSKDCSVDYLFSIDPVLAKWKEKIDGCAYKVKEEWRFDLPFGFTLKKDKFFPIMPNPNKETKVYNVFQRRSLLRWRWSDWYNCPIGCGVAGAYSFDEKKDVLSQYDETIFNHMDLREIYSEKILEKIQNILK